MSVESLPRETWQARATAHAARLAPYVEPHLARRRQGVQHPVHDFLFSYYSQRPAQLLRWHPGFGVQLEDAAEYDGLKGYVVSRGSTTVSEEYVASQRALVESIHRLLVATASRPAHTGCFGLHEWAMVYRTDETRHPQPLRLGGAGTDTVVESHRIACSHFDAFRFFTEAARPRNTVRPGRDDRPEFEQPGCLHAGMDLYKHAFRLTPMVPSEVVADSFELAWQIRELDMRAAPYDLTGFTLDPTGEPWTPVKVETPEGKQDYVAQQREFAERSQALRERLIAESERLLHVADPG